MQDRLHQQRRLELVPGLAAALAALAAEPGCAAAALSGSGPTLLGLFSEVRPAAGDSAQRILREHGIGASVHRVRPDLDGLWWEARS